MVRQLVGYDRDESAAALSPLERVDELVRVEVNGWLPVMQLVAKERDGAKVRKRYDVPQTPFARALAAGVVPADARQVLETLRHAPGPRALRRQLDVELERLWALRVGAAVPDGRPSRDAMLATTA